MDFWFWSLFKMYSSYLILKVVPTTALKLQHDSFILEDAFSAGVRMEGADGRGRSSGAQSGVVD